MGLLFTYALTYGGSFVSLFNPFVGLLIYICFAIIKPEALWYWSVPAGNYSRIIAFSLLIGWAARGFGNWSFGSGRAVLLLLLAFYGWAIVSGLASPDGVTALSFVEQKGKVVLPCLVAMTICNSFTQLKALAWTIVGSHGFLAYEFNLSYFQGFNRLEEVGLGGFLDNNCMAIGFATVIGTSFFLGLSEQKLWRKWLAWLCSALIAHAIFFSFSRGAMVGFCVVGASCFFLMPKQPRHYLWLLVAAAVALRMAGPGVRAEFLSSFEAKEEKGGVPDGRVYLWAACIDLMQKEPILGVGAGQFRNRAPEYGLPNMMAHSLWLQIGAEIGVPGLVFLLTYYLLVMWRLWRAKPSFARIANSDSFVQFLPDMVISGLVGFVISAQFVSLDGLEVPYYAAILGATALKVQSQTPAGLPFPWAGPLTYQQNPYQQPFMHRGQ